MGTAQRCGLPANSFATKHCFNDVSHHTCCLLGPKAREMSLHLTQPGESAAERVGHAARHAWFNTHSALPRTPHLHASFRHSSHPSYQLDTGRVVLDASLKP
jgi:hypothetical protein